MLWDPTQYVRYADERGRPFVDLLARIAARTPHRIVDLGCGPGGLTSLLTERWPGAAVEGLDSSPEMIAAAASVSGVSFRVADIAAWTPEPDVDVIISNAALQWVPDHLPLVSSWAKALPADGWLAFQVPGNFASPSHVLMRSLAESPRWSATLAGVLRHDDAVASPEVYASTLADAGLEVDVWETTYLHVLPGSDPVLDWVRGTGLRPVLAALDDAGRAEFVASYARALRTAYPAGPHGTVFPFRRIFAVGHRPA